MSEAVTQAGSGAGAPTAGPAPVGAGPEEAQARRRRLMERLEALARSQGHEVFDGRWVTSREAQRRYRRLWWRSVLIVSEVVVLCAALTAVAGFVGMVLARLVGVL